MIIIRHVAVVTAWLCHVSAISSNVIRETDDARIVDSSYTKASSFIILFYSCRPLSHQPRPVTTIDLTLTTRSIESF
jgi:hypothetical protein